MSWQEFGEQESAGGITDFEITVTNAFFAIDEKYSEAVGADVYFLNWEGTTDVVGHEQMTRDGFHPKWALDPDWMSLDGGATVKSQSGKGKLGKAVGRMMNVALQSINESGIDKDGPGNPFSKGTPRDAVVWIGSKWFIEDVTTEFGNGMSSTDQMPTKFLGMVDGAVAATPVVSAVPAAPPPATPAPGLRDSVVAMAGSIPDHSAFVSAAMAIPGVSADAALVTEIVSPTGLWAAAQA